MLDHVSITVSDIAAAERFHDAVMRVLGVVKVGRRDDWLGCGEQARSAYPDRVSDDPHTSGASRREIAKSYPELV